MCRRKERLQMELDGNLNQEIQAMAKLKVKFLTQNKTTKEREKIEIASIFQ